MNDPKLTAYALGQLEGAEREEMRARVEASPELAAEVAAIANLAETLRSEMRATIRSAGGARPVSRRRLIWSILGGAGLALAFGLVVHWPTYYEVAAPIPATESSRSAKVVLDPPVVVKPQGEVTADEPAKTQVAAANGGADVRVDLTGFGASNSQGLSEAQLRAIFEGHRRQIEDCFREGRSKIPDLHGHLTLTWQEGSVQLTNDGVGSLILSNCLIDSARRWLPVGTGAFPIIFN